jgi:hypothetical protein
MGLGNMPRVVKQRNEERKLGLVTFEIFHSRSGSFALQSGGRR